ncbi:MAG: hypothetical protein OEY18_14175, partial [Candidatus Aminicenantes bacterium]|nr:hypothetical protein [Candidatus Aminicenantes bacterium]
SAVKYLDPDYPLVRNDRSVDKAIILLDRDWVARNGPAWLKRYDRATSLKTRFQWKLITAGSFVKRKVKIPNKIQNSWLFRKILNLTP